MSAEPRSVPVCRRYLRERLTGAPPPLIDNAELCVSELVTNAVLHAGTDIEVRVEQVPDACRLEVRDANPAPPLRHHHTEGATTGRGLEMVSGVARTWGSPRWTGAGRRSGAR
ncbi:MAG TPA: ATP-binding protein [Mycobacteriales bacterium]|nr:ATP-binding protein [Mycobacteriales bacterium]